MHGRQSLLAVVLDAVALDLAAGNLPGVEGMEVVLFTSRDGADIVLWGAYTPGVPRRRISLPLSLDEMADGGLERIRERCVKLRESV